MTLAPVPAREAPALRATNPVTRLVALLPPAVVLVSTLDVLTPAVTLTLELALVAASGIRWGRFWRATALVWVLAPLGAVTTLLYGRPSGATLLNWTVVHITEGSAELALATMLRVLALALPSIVLFAGVDPTALADGLGQVLRLPARFVIGALAGLRMLVLLGDDWRAVELARRARGIGDRRGAIRVAGQAFALLVLAIRRATLLATAMEARGFPGAGRRTWARESRLGAADAALFVLGATVALVALGVALGTGSWRFVGA